MNFSLLLIVKGRTGHLENVLSGIERSTVMPDDVVIVHMNEPITTVTSSLSIRQFVIEDKSLLPLARARNYAAAQARFKQLLFLDVDCIPGSDTCATLLAELKPSRLLMADPQYLQQPISPLNDRL